MLIIIVCLILFGYILIATEHITHINKATIAIFVGVVSWILYISWGTDFVLQMHSQEFSQYVGGFEYTALTVKRFIAEHVFLQYGYQLSAIVLYLLATMNIVSVLNANGCFDFVYRFLRVKDSRHILWGFVVFTFLISCNLDNLTTTILMLMIMRRIVANHRSRMWIGAAIVISANCGGAITVIGDPTSLVVWTKGAVTPTNFSATLALSAIIATIIPTYLISRQLPENIDIIRPTVSYRGDCAPLRTWQQIAMLIIGLGGLWFVPTFHRITILPPFLGALCVLGVLWVMHEMFNLNQIRSNQPANISGDRHFQFESLQIIIYIIGVYLAVAVLIETGVMHSISAWSDEWIHDIYIMSLAMGVVSSVLDNIAVVLTGINIYPVLSDVSSVSNLAPDYAKSFLLDGQYWHLIIYSGCVAGCLLPIGNISGYTLMKTEDVSIAWYVRHIMPKVLIGWLLGLGTYFVVQQIVS